jgi:hypothetical protein
MCVCVCVCVCVFCVCVCVFIERVCVCVCCRLKATCFHHRAFLNLWPCQHSRCQVDANQLFATTEEWPFQPRVEELCQDLFSPDWCVRQGACLGLREIIKLQGRVSLCVMHLKAETRGESGFLTCG